MGRVSLIAFSDQTVQKILTGSDYTFSEERQNEEYLKNLYSSMISIRDDISGIYMFTVDNMIFTMIRRTDSWSELECRCIFPEGQKQF